MPTNVDGFVVFGAIEEKWLSLGGLEGILGPPFSNETSSTFDNIGRFQNFQGGIVSWHPQIGAYEVHGLILEHWLKLGREQFGYPITDETSTLDGRGRFNHFRVFRPDGSVAGDSSIYWTQEQYLNQEIGAHEIFGGIRDKWASMGWEASPLGYPVDHEVPTPDGVGRRQDFQKGMISWYPETGATPFFGYLLDPIAIDGTPAQAFASHKTRASAIARQYAMDNPLDFTDNTIAGENETIRLIAHLQAVSDDDKFPSRDLVSTMLRKLVQGDSLVGTNYKGLTGVAARKGDYDFALKGLIVIVYRYRHLLSDDDFERILVGLGPQVPPLVPPDLVGPYDPSLEKHTVKAAALGVTLGSAIGITLGSIFSGGILIPILTGIGAIAGDTAVDYPETENHLLMINSSKYLFNQLFFDKTGDQKYNNNNPENGMARWLLGYMHTIAKHDFLEFNSRSYQRLSLHALFNLHEFARDKSIRDAAQILLDYTMVKFAISSSRQRRICPFRRMKENTNRPDNRHNELLEPKVEGDDAVIGFFLMYAGSTDVNGNPTNRFSAGWAFNALIAGLATYRPPPSAYILAMKRDIPAFQHRFYHGKRPQIPAGDQAEGGVEIYYSSPSFLLTAGGMFLNSGYGGEIVVGDEQAAIAQSTTLLPTRADVKFADLIRFDPYPDERRAVNTAVHLGFACGANLRPAEKKIFRTDSTTHAPTLASHNGGLFVSWKGSGNQNLNIAKVYTTDVLGIDGIENLEGKITLPSDSEIPSHGTSEQSPALASHNGRLFLAWKGAGNDNLNLMFSEDNGASFRGKKTFLETSYHAPALVSHDGRLFLAWTGREASTGDEKLNIAKVTFFGNTAGGFGIEGLEGKVILGDASEQSPALASHNGRLFLAWKGAGNDNLNLMFSEDNGASFRGKKTFLETSYHAPALVSHDGRLFLAWTGREASTGDEKLNIAKVTFFGNTAGGLGIEGLEGKVILGDASEQSPALASHNGRLFLAWKGAGNDNLNLLSSRDGTFQSGPWHFSDLSKFGLYVAIYRTPPAQPDQLDTPLDNLGLLYAMEKSDTMSFEKFKQLTLERNTTLPANLQYGGHYIFHSADDHRFSFWLHPSLEKYQARITRMDEVNPVVDLTSLPLVDGPYLKAPSDHNGYIEIRDPECTAPLVLDFRAPENPDRRDNIRDCPGPWLDRAQALLSFAQKLAEAKKYKEEIASLTDRVEIYQRLTEIDPTKYRPDLASALNLLAGNLWALVVRLLEAQRIDEVSAPALEAIQVYRQAAAAGAEVTEIATSLIRLSSWLAHAGLAADSLSAAQAAVDVLRGVQPPASEQVSYLALLAQSLRTLVLQLLPTQQINEVSALALEATQVYRQAAAAGAEVTGIAHDLQTLSYWLANVGLTAEAVSVAQSAVDVLRGVQPPASEQTNYLTSLAGNLWTLVRRLLEAQRISEVSVPALEAIQVYRQAAAAGAEVTEIADSLRILSSWLANAGLTAEAAAAAAAEADMLP
jgi:hypothetical protein